MKLCRQFLVVLVAGVVSASASAQQLKLESEPAKLGFAADRLNRVTQAFQGFVDSGQIPGAVVLIARNDKIAYFQAFGFRDRDQKIAMTTDSIFRIASMSKPIVSVGAMMLAEEGKLDIGACSTIFQSSRTYRFALSSPILSRARRKLSCSLSCGP